MFSTVQQKAFTHPTARRNPHHSQVPLNFEDTFIVTAVQPPRKTVPPTWKPDHSRQCWTTGNLTKTRTHPVTVNAEFPYVRAYTTIQPSDSQIHAARTAILPKTGQVKLTAFEHEKTTPSSASAPSSGSSSTRFFASKRRREKTRFLTTRPIPAIHDITVGDLQQAIEIEFPEIQAPQYYRGSAQPAAITARPLGCTPPHSRVTSMKDPRHVFNLTSKHNEQSQVDIHAKTPGPKTPSEPDTEGQSCSKVASRSVSRVVSRAQSVVEAKVNTTQENMVDNMMPNNEIEDSNENPLKIPIEIVPINIPTSANEED